MGGLGPSKGRNFGLKSGVTKLEAPKVPRIEMPRGMRNGKRTPLPADYGSGWAVVELCHNL